MFLGIFNKIALESIQPRRSSADISKEPLGENGRAATKIPFLRWGLAKVVSEAEQVIAFGWKIMKANILFSFGKTSTNKSFPTRPRRWIKVNRAESDFDFMAYFGLLNSIFYVGEDAL